MKVCEDDAGKIYAMKPKPTGKMLNFLKSDWTGIFNR